MQLRYGNDEILHCDVAGERIVAHFEGPARHPDLTSEIARSLSAPLDFPALSKAVIPDDRVALALDNNVANPAPIVAEIWNQFAGTGLRPEQITIIQPPSAHAGRLPDPRAELPAPIREQIEWTIHDEHDDDACSYLASSAAGERIYLAKALVEAEVVVTIGQVGFDPLIGFRGTNSVFFPGLSNAEARERARGQGHRELGPDDERPLRQLVDEIGWLLGNQFSIQLVPSVGGGVSRVLAGASDTVLRAGKTLLKRNWTCTLAERAEIVVVAMESVGHADEWEQLGAVLRTARNLATRGGKVLIVSDLGEEPGQGVQFVREVREPTDAIQPLRSLAPADLVTATQLAQTVDWADVYLLSRLPSDLVEDLFMIPVETQREALRVIQGDATCAFLDGAQYVYAAIEQ